MASLGRVSKTCNVCGKPNDRIGMRCQSCHQRIIREQWRRYDAQERANQRAAAAEAQTQDPDVVPAHKLHEWMCRNIA